MHKQLIVPSIPADAIVEIPGEGLFFNNGSPVHDSPVEDEPQEPELPEEGE